MACGSTGVLITQRLYHPLGGISGGSRRALATHKHTVRATCLGRPPLGLQQHGTLDNRARNRRFVRAADVERCLAVPRGLRHSGRLGAGVLLTQGFAGSSLNGGSPGWILGAFPGWASLCPGVRAAASSPGADCAPVIQRWPRPTPPGYRVGGLVGQFQQHRQQPRPRAAPTRHLHRRSAPAVTSKDTPGVVQGDAGRSRQARGRQCAH